MKKFLAFTLAETLIVMGIIGIVSALTLPNLNSSTGEKEKVAKVKKIYQNLDDAIGRATAVYGPVNEWFINDNNATAQITRFGDRVTEFMKVSKNCGVTTNQRCFSNAQVKTINNGFGSASDYDTQNNSYKFQVADGTSLSFTISDASTSAVLMSFNIDGPKGKNTIGNDVFSLNYNVSNNTIDIGTNYPAIEHILTTGTGQEAASWVINFDNMDYLKAGTDGKCKNSNVTLNALATVPVTSCK